MFGRWPFCKTEGSRISSLRVYLLVIVISLCFCLGREGRIAYIILDMLRLNWIIHVKVCIYLPPPHYYLFPPLLLPLSSSAFTLFPPFSLIIKQAHRYLFLDLCPPPPPPISILPNAPSRTRTRVYASPSEHSAICATTPSSFPRLHILRASAVPISPVSFVHHLLTSTFSVSAYSCPLRCIFLKLSNAHYTNPCVGGSRCGSRGDSSRCPCVDHPWCQHGPPSV